MFAYKHILELHSFLSVCVCMKDTCWKWYTDRNFYKYWILDAGLWQLNSRRSTLDTGFRALDSRGWTLDSGLRTLYFGCWTLFLTGSEQNQNPVSRSVWLIYWKFFKSESLRTWYSRLCCRDYIKGTLMQLWKSPYVFALIYR